MYIFIVADYDIRGQFFREHWLQNFGTDFYSFNGHTFKVYDTSRSWGYAKIFCENLDGHLATSTSAEKNAFLTSIIYRYAYIGGFIDTGTGAFAWVTGEDWDYANWKNENYANATWRTDMPTVMLNPDSTWERATSAGVSYICEWNEEFSDIEKWFRSLGYRYFDGRIFKVFNNKVAWSTANAACEAMGGHLVSVTSQEKNDFLNKISTTDSEHLRVWTCGYFDGTTITWLNGDTSDYVNWATGAPTSLEVLSSYCYIYLDYTFNNVDDGNPNQGYICEWDCDFRESSVGGSSGDIMNFSDALKLSITKNGKLALTSPIWNIDKTSEATLEADTWHHILLRLSNRTASVYLDGTLTFSTTVSGVSITPENLTLGGYIGYMDEFVFRNGAGTEAPVVPTSAYEMEAGTSSTPTVNTAPVTRAVWSCSNLPEGLTLSSSGVLSGHPTTAGTYNCNVQVATNWGTTNKVIKITVSE